MEFLLLIPSLILGGILLYVLVKQGEDTDAYLRAITQAIEEIGAVSAKNGKLVESELIRDLTDKIQHPEIPSRPPAVVTTELPEPEPLPATGQILPDEEIDNGRPPNG